MHTPEYFLLWVWFTGYMDHRSETCDAAKITYANVVIAMLGSDLRLRSSTDNEEADVSETEKL